MSGAAVATYDGHSITQIRDKQWMHIDTVRAILWPVERTARKMEASFDSQQGKRVLERTLRPPQWVTGFIFLSWISNNRDQRAQNYCSCYSPCNYVINIRSTIWKHSTESVFWVDEEEIRFPHLRGDCNLVHILPVGVMATAIRDAECTNQLLGIAVIFAVFLSVLICVQRWKFSY